MEKFAGVIDFLFCKLSNAFRLLSRCSKSFTRLETLRHAGEDLGRSSSENTRSAGLNSCTRSDTLLQAGDFIKSWLEQLCSKVVPDPIKPLNRQQVS